MKYQIRYVAKSGDVYILRAWPLEEKLNFVPGQFAMLEYNGVKRPYSIASSPNWEYLEFMITKKENGKFTGMLDEMLDKKIEIAGLAPIMSILRYINEEKIEGDFHLFFSTRYRNHHPYQSELQHFNIGKVERFTREGDPRLSPEDLSNFDLSEYTLYICGAIDFAKQFKDLKAKRIKVEAWG